jgi:outer membrane protein OmpU
MNKLTTIGASALCGSLAAVSAANAGDMTVTGGVDLSWISLPKQNVGNPIGIGSNLTFSGSGELDNGWSVAYTVANTNAQAFSNANVVVTIPGMGDLRIDGGTSGTGIDRMDDMTPNVWEEAYGTGLAGTPNTVSGVAGGAGFEFTPSMTPDGLTARIAYSPNAGAGDAGDKASAESSGSTKKSGIDITLEASSDMTGMEGLTLYGGISRIDQHQNNTAINGDIDERTVGVKYAVGGFTLGYQWSEEDTGRATTNTKYSNDAYGITFSINDDLSIGYNNYKSDRSSTTNVESESSSVQIAYSMGGVSVRLADASIDNQNYTTGAANQRDATTLSVALAF